MGGLDPSQLNMVSHIQSAPNEYASVLGWDNIANIQSLNLTFLGINLAEKPEWSMFGQIFTNFNPVLLIPILSGASALISTIQMQRQQAITNPNASANPTMKGMMYMMPVFSTWIAFMFPAGVGLYWFFSNVTQMGQTMIMNKIYNPREIAEKAKQALEEQRERERLERIEAKKKRKEDNKPAPSKSKEDVSQAENETVEGLSQKEINRRKLAEARKRDAEKYGETYVDVTDDDLI